MKKLKLSFTATALLLLFAVSGTYSQWTFNGFVTGAGTFPSISVYGPTNIVVVGGPAGTPIVARSINSGASFTLLGTSGILLDLFCVWAIDANTIYAGDGGNPGGTTGGNARVYKTINGGTSWTTVFSTGGTAGFFNAVVFSRSNPMVGVAQSDPPLGAGTAYFVQRTIDGGTTWAPVTTPGISGAASSQNGLVVIDANFFGFGLNAGASRVDVTANGGTSWTVQSLGVAGAFISGFAFHDNKLTGCACSNTSLPTIARTVNGGTSWGSVSIGAGVTGYCNLKWVPGTNTVYVLGGTGAGGVCKKSIDGGLTWTTMTTAGITSITHADLLVSGGIVYAYAVAQDGSIIGLVDPLTAIDPTSTGVPTEYSIQQNYPNPFNPSTTIKYAIPQSGNVSIKIYDMLGSEVMSVVNKYHTAGNYIENVDLSGYASGVYYYSIVSGDFTQTKKMTLVK